MFKERLRKVSTQSGVYIMKNAQNDIIYIGKAKNLKNRLSQYFSISAKASKVQSMVNNVADFEYIVTPSELDAFMLEANLVKKHQPFYNILLKDDKSFSYIKIDFSKPFPRPEVVRSVKNDKAKYFGPYFNGISAADILKLINYNYKLRTCKNLQLNSKRECLNYDLGLCSAPCTKKISKEEYHKVLLEVVDFLKGKINLYTVLNEKMQKYAAEENFEQALIFRNFLTTLDRLKARAIDRLPNNADIDIWGFAGGEVSVATLLVVRMGKMIGFKKFVLENQEEFSSEILVEFYKNKNIAPLTLVPKELEDKTALEEYLKNINKKTKIVFPKKGINKKLLDQANENAKEILSKNFITNSTNKSLEVLQSLKNKLGLKNIPYRIEGFDISHISGTDKVASMVVFTNGDKNTKMYRKFKIKSVDGVDDFASLKEVVLRRLGRLSGEDLSFSTKPSLILIDGGKGQLSACQEIILEKDIDVISLAEREEEIFVPGRSNPFVFSKSSRELKILQAVRDEAHRFAITFHKKLRGKRQTKSVLDEIKGLGPVKKKALLDKYKTIKNLKEAKCEDLILIKGFDKALANQILEILNKG